MQEKPMPYDTVDAYMQNFPADVRQKLQMVRDTIRAVVPDAEETISYQMPAYVYRGRILVYFAAFRHHIGFYPTASGIEQFKAELAAWKGAKGSVQFPFREPLPLDLIARITAFRAAENARQEQERPQKRYSRAGPL